MMTHVDPQLEELDLFAGALNTARPHNIGFPGSTDFDYTPLADFFARHLLNNVGDPQVDGAAANHTKVMERWVVGQVADLFRAPVDNRWGYITSGGTEGNLYGLSIARSLYPDAVVYYSSAAHSSVDKAVGLLNMPRVRIRVSRWDEIDYQDLRGQVSAHRDRPVVVVATIGTTMTEAVDDVRVITNVLNELAIRDRYVHADAALAGIPLGLLDPDDRPGFDFADGADSITVSGHKFIGSPLPYGVVTVRNSIRAKGEHSGLYTGSPDTTITGSRCGHAALLAWWRLQHLGWPGMRERAAAARALAAYTQVALEAMEWPSHRFANGFTVCLQSPPPQILKKWVLATTGGRSHVITMPGVTLTQIDSFLADMAAAGPPHPAARILPSIPTQRGSASQ